MLLPSSDGSEGAENSSLGGATSAAGGGVEGIVGAVERESSIAEDAFESIGVSNIAGGIVSDCVGDGSSSGIRAGSDFAGAVVPKSLAQRPPALGGVGSGCLLDM